MSVICETFQLDLSMRKSADAIITLMHLNISPRLIGRSLCGSMFYKTLAITLNKGINLNRLLHGECEQVILVLIPQ